MKAQTHKFEQQFLARARHSLESHYLPRIVRCLNLLSEEQIWWRPHPSSNSVGNLILHLSGNVRQWIVSGLGGAPDRRQRDKEFSELGPIPRRNLLTLLRKTTGDAAHVLAGLTSRELAQAYAIQGFRETGLEAVHHVVEHFAFHAGQIIYVTKMSLRRDLGFTRLPTEPSKRKGLPAL